MNIALFVDKYSKVKCVFPTLFKFDSSASPRDLTSYTRKFIGDADESNYVFNLKSSYLSVVSLHEFYNQIK